MTTIAPLARRRSAAPRGSNPPVGLLGEGRNTAFAPSQAAASASRSTDQSAPLGTSTSCAPATSAPKAYIPNVGEAITMRSPVSMKMRNTRSMISSAPAPATMHSGGTPWRAARASRRRRCSGSG